MKVDFVCEVGSEIVYRIIPHYNPPIIPHRICIITRSYGLYGISQALCIRIDRTTYRITYIVYCILYGLPTLVIDCMHGCSQPCMYMHANKDVDGQKTLSSATLLVATTPYQDAMQVGHDGTSIRF
jgi:hypothetical protein